MRYSKSFFIMVFVLYAVPNVFSGQQCGLSLMVRVHPSEQVLGAPMELECSVRNTSTEILKVPSHLQLQSYLEVTVIDHPEVVVFSKPTGALMLEEIKPDQEIVVRFGPEYGPYFCAAGEYRISVRLVEKALQAIASSGCVQLEASTLANLREPTGVDKDAFNTALEGASTSRAVCSEATIVSQFLMKQSLVEQHPTALYAGYAFVEWKPILPGFGSSMAERVAILSGEGFFKRYPSATVNSERITLSEEVQKREALFSAYLEQNPGFPYRAELEERLGELRLALGKNKAALQSLSWLVNDGVEKGGRYQEAINAMVELNLISESEAEAACRKR